MNKLDFLVIGAQKAGTTALYKYLQQHPNISFPITGKEVPFFSNDANYERGLNQFIQQNYHSNNDNQILGKVSPQYLLDNRVPKRIEKTIPQTKLIVILRNPIERAFSHYLMSVNRDLEKRSFKEAITELLEEKQLNYARQLTANESNKAETSCYIVWGEYARLLSSYRRFFERNQLLIIFNENLRNNRRETLNEVFEFINVSNKVNLININQEYFTNQQQQILNQIKKNNILKFIWKYYPNFLRNKTSNIIRGFIQYISLIKDYNKSNEIEPIVRKKLTNFYQKDVEELVAYFQVNPPWEDFK